MPLTSTVSPSLSLGTSAFQQGRGREAGPVPGYRALWMPKDRDGQTGWQWQAESEGESPVELGEDVSFLISLLGPWHVLNVGGSC